METDTGDSSLEAVSRHDATGRDTEQYTVSVAEAAELFTQSGLPRTERAIQRFCKKGDLICAFQDTPSGSRYLIKRSSIGRLIQQKLQALAATPDDSSDASRHDATGRDMTRHEEASHDHHGTIIVENTSTSQGPDVSRRVATDTDTHFQKLREENLVLKIDNSAREQFINHLKTELEKSHDQVRELSYELGRAHTRVAQLEAPRSEPEDTPDTSRPVATDELESIVIPISVGEGSANNDAASKLTATRQPDAEPVVDPRQKRSWLGKMFGV